MEEKKWYLTLNYQETKRIIRENLESMSRSFIATGYYLRMIKDTEGYKEDGYKDIWEFAEDQYGIKRSTASRWMDMNAKFSEGGNSPVLAEEFKEYQKSQLQEMLYLPEEKLEEVAPDMTVREIRKVAKPESAKKQKESRLERGCITGWSKHPESCSCCGHDGAECCSQCDKDCNSRCGWVDNPHVTEVSGQLEAACDVAQDPEPKLDKSSSCPPEQSSCPRTEWGTEPEQQHEGSLECAKCWRDYMERQKDLKKLEDREASEECATSHIEENISEDTALINRFVLEYCESYCNLTALIQICRENDKNAVRAKKVQEMLAPCGESGGGKWGFSYTFYGYSRGLKFEQEGQEASLSYIQFVKAIEEFYGPWEEEEKTMDVVETGEHEDNIAEKETAIETKGVEVETDPEESFEEIGELSDLEIAQRELEKARKLLDDILECYSEDDMIARRQKVIIDALAGHIADLDMISNPSELLEQPELPRLKNNDQRKEWLRNYKEWGLWYKDENIGVKYYRYIFADGTQLIAEEYPNSYFDYTSYLHLVGGPSERTLNQHGSYRYPYHEKYTRYPDNESEIVEFLKHIQKGDKKSC